MNLRALKTALAVYCCACAALARNKPVFSENFESGKIDPAKWDLRVEGTATIAVEKVDDRTANTPCMCTIRIWRRAAVRL
jgi:hypothetical protein